MSEELKIWRVSGAKEVERLSPFSEMPSEWEFEELLVGNPELLESGLRLVGRQTRTRTGWLDLLAVDADGRLVVFELKRGTLAREAVTQVLDYASDLDAMDSSELAEHITDRSGTGGVQRIEDFEQWYADKFRGDDLSRLLPPRMVLVGLGVDPAAERMARFISAGPVDLSVVTFHGFQRDGERWLARQVEAGPGPGPRHPTVAERRRALREYLAAKGYADVFDRIREDIRGRLPEQGVWVETGRYGVSFQLAEPDNRQTWKTYFGLQAGYITSEVNIYSVSILPQAIHWGGDALGRLREAVRLYDWTHGGQFLRFKSADDWDQVRSAVLEFVDAVVANRVGRTDPGAH
jgi:hypothetical protein